MTTKTFRTGLFTALIAVMATTLLLPTNVMSQETPDVIPETFEEKKAIMLAKVLENVKLMSERKSLTEDIDSVETNERAALEQRMKEIDSKLDANVRVMKAIQDADRAKAQFDSVKVSQVDKALERLQQSNLPIVMSGSAGESIYIKLNMSEQLNDPDAAIRAIIGNNIPYELEYGEFGHFADACASRTDDCDPIVAGIRVEGTKHPTVGTGTWGCTLGLEVKDSIWPWAAHGWLTAGHCFKDNTSVYQPTTSDPAIGTVNHVVYQTGED